MLAETYIKLRQFEDSLKKCVIDRFKNNLSPEKQSMLISIDFVSTSDLTNAKSGFEVQGIILRNMLDSILNIKCTKVFTLSDGTSMNIPYGEDIENDLINYYSGNIAQKYKFGIDKIDKQSSTIDLLIKTYGDDFDNVMLSKNAIEILSHENLIAFTGSYEANLLKPYESVSIFSNINITNKQEPTPNEEMETINLQSSEVQSEEVDKTKQVQQSILSEEQYQDLCMKYARNEELSTQELQSLLISTPKLVDENEAININVNTNSLSEPMQQDVKFRGFTLSSFSSYFIILSIILLVILGIIIL